MKVLDFNAHKAKKEKIVETKVEIETKGLMLGQLIELFKENGDMPIWLALENSAGVTKFCDLKFDPVTCKDKTTGLVLEVAI